MIRSRDPERRAGFVLPAVVLMLLGLTALVHGTLLLARHQRAAAASGVTALQARLAAEAGVLSAAGGLDRRAARKLRGGGVVRVPERPVGGRATVTAHVEPLGGEWLWVEGEGTADLLGLRGLRRVARLYWLLDPALRVRALRAAVEHGGELEVSATSEVRGGGPFASPEEWPDGICDLPPGTADPAAARLPPAVGMSAPDPDRSADPLASVPRLGLMRGRDLAERADARPTAVRGTPRPSLRLGRCRREDRWNWGEPLEPESPCGRHRPLVVAAEQLILDGGRGQGVLATGGDLTLNGTRFTGLVLVGGSLRLADGARIDGAVRVRGDVSVVEGATIAGSRCAVHRSLEVRPPALPPLPAGPGSWIPLHGR